ncbi:MAG: efflux RND transporter permease subunit [bacterium]
MFSYFYRRPYLTFALIAAFFIMGLLGLISMPKNLFPDAERPQVIVITQIPGATAKVAAATVSKPIEEEISRLGMIREVSSVNVANFSIVKAEFEYKKGLDAAAVDVSNALSIARSKLPANANPAIYTAGAFTLPVEVVTLTPKDENLSLPDLRKIADSFLKPYLLSKPAIGNVEVFGGYQSAINIALDPLKAKKYGLDFNKVASIISATNKDMPLGFLKGKDGFFTLTYYGDKAEVSQLKQTVVAPNVRLSDIADVEWSYQKRFSGYMGNGQEGIAMAIQRAPGGSVLDVSKAARAELVKLREQYPRIDFQISDTQRDLIETANTNMLEALRDAIIYTLIVLLFFLGNFKAIMAAGLSIPMVFFGTMGVIYLMGGELNIVVYTAIILALGMLVDDAVVVLENIERHLTELNEDLNTAIETGTREVLSPIFAGTIATIVIMFPLMFVGDFPQHIFRPLISTLIIALLVSWFLSITFIPKLSVYLYRNGTEKTGIEKSFDILYQKTFGRLIAPYVGILKFTNGRFSFWRKLLLTLAVVALLAVSVKTIMPLIGKDTMPPMDTGIIKAHVVFSANDRVEDSESRIKPFLTWLHEQPEVTMSSVAFGSEAGVLSLGSGNLPSEATITVNCVNRFERDKSLWQIEDEIRDQLHRLPGLKEADIYDFGATAISSIKAPVDVRIKSSDYEDLPEVAQRVAAAMEPIRGITSVSQSWDSGFSEIKIDIDTNKALSYGLTPAAIAQQIPIRGQVLSLSGNLSSMTTQYVRLYLKGRFSEDIQSLKSMLIQTPKGEELPLGALAKVTRNLTQAKIERDEMLYSIDVSGYRASRPVTHLTEDTEAALAKVDTAGYVVTQEGDIVSLNDSFKRMIKAIGIGIVVLTLTLIVIYRSVKLGLIMIVVLPLSMIGASWGMLIFDKPSCMPSLIGILLLFGIIIKNAVLLVDFYQDFRRRESPFESALGSVRVRFRPVMMTAFGTIAGMIPIALEQAVGLERLSPLADVAVGGLVVGTLLTLIYVPMFAYGLDRDGHQNGK